MGPSAFGCIGLIPAIPVRAGLAGGKRPPGLDGGWTEGSIGLVLVLMGGSVGAGDWLLPLLGMIRAGGDWVLIIGGGGAGELFDEGGCGDGALDDADMLNCQ